MHGMRARLIRGISTHTLAVAVMVLGLAGPILWIVLSRTDRSTGDIALIELRTRDVLSRHPPLTGAYSRYGWSHPGPLMFELFAIPYRLFGNDADALRLTVLLLNMAVIGVVSWLLVRRGVAAGLLVSAATVALVWGLLPHSLSEGWNVTVAILPFMLTMVACWCALCGDRWALMVAALAFSFVFQAHIGFGLALVPLFGITLTWRGIGAWRSSRTISRRSLVGVGAVIVLFLPVVYDSLTHWPGNLGRLAKWSLNNDEPKVGLADGLRIMGRTSSLSFLSHPQFPGRFVLTIDSISSGFVPGALLVLLAVASVIAVRRAYRAEALLCGCLALVWVAGAVAASNIAEPLLPWLIDWLQPLGWLTWAAVGLVGWRTIQARARTAARWPLVQRVGAALVAVVFIFGTIDYGHENATTDYLSSAAAPAVDQFTAAAETLGNDAPIAIVYDGDPLTAGTLMTGVINRLDRSGYHMCVTPDLAYQFGSSRVCAGRLDHYLMIRSEATDTPAPEGATTLAISDPLTPDERAEADSISEQLAAILVAYDREDDVFLVFTPLVRLILDGDPPEELARLTPEIDRLGQLRKILGTRYGLYRIPV